jgi:hypothetical protein
MGKSILLHLPIPIEIERDTPMKRAAFYFVDVLTNKPLEGVSYRQRDF